MLSFAYPVRQLLVGLLYLSAGLPPAHAVHQSYAVAPSCFVTALKTAFQLERFDQPAQYLRNILTQNKAPEEILDELVNAQVDARAVVFKLEGLCRTYRSADQELFQVLRKDFKALAKALGEYKLQLEMLEMAKTVDAPPATREVLRENIRVSKAETVQFLKKEKWIRQKNDRLARLEKDLAHFDWPKPKRDRKDLLDAYIEQVRIIEDSHYDMADLDEGLHKLRRQLRWISIDFQSSLGGITLNTKTCPIELFAGLAHDPAYVDSKYGKLPPNPKVKNPITISSCLFYAVTKYIGAFGDLKDTAEQVNLLAKALLRSGQASYPASARSMAEQLHEKMPKHTEVLEKARAAYKEIQDSGLMKAMRQEFEKQLKE